MSLYIVKQVVRTALARKPRGIEKSAVARTTFATILKPHT